ncbi:MAG: tetratricopeptide repeat protein [Thiohalocapsa sp.]
MFSCYRHLGDRLRRWRRSSPFAFMLVLALTAFVLTAFVCRDAGAQPLSGSERTQLQVRKEALFAQTLRDPANLDVAFAYADAAAKLGDFEAAVSALDRMLLFNPNLPRVQLEIGALYFRMGSYDISRSYFQKALAANPPAEVRARIERYLGEIARRSGVQHFTGFVLFGVQTQSDANLAPGSPIIQSPVGPVLLGSDFVKKRDENVFGTGSFLYSYDLGTQTRDAVEVGGTGYANHYSSVTRLDLGLAELTVGPRINTLDPAPGIQAASLKPYAIVNDVSLGGNQYFNTFGVGSELTSQVWQDFHFRSIFEFRQKNFTNAPDRPLSRGLNGSDKLVSLFVSRPITVDPASELSLEFDFLRQDTRLARYANDTYGGAAAYRIRYPDPTGWLPLPWETTFIVGYSHSFYDGPDPCCSVSSNPLVFKTAARSDARWRFGITQNFQVSEDVSVLLQVQRDIVSSNLSLYGYTNNSVLIGPLIRF